MTKAFMIAAPRSGSGKTTITLALVAALRRRGVAVRTAKSGPDYIDPAFHQAASGAPCPNLDTWAMQPAQLDAVLPGDADLLLIEASMGLFDGVEAPKGRTGAAADLAARYDLPVLLVLDVSGQSQSAAAVARGFALHDPAVRIAGLVLNRVGSDRHRDGIVAAMRTVGLPVLGSVRRDAQIALPERHLGLVQAAEHATLPALIERLADLAETSLDLDAILALATPLPSPAPGTPFFPPPGQRIALAQDQAFSFIYPHLLAAWRQGGAEIRPFSPLDDEPPSADCDACWLPGGYPELHAARLAAAARFRAGMRSFAGSVHGECGGYMVLGAGLEDATSERHAMLGLLDHSTSFARRRMNLGYRQAHMLAGSPFGPQGTRIRGHEFHYAVITDKGRDPPLAELADAAGRPLGPAGGRRHRVTGSFFHAIAPA